MGGFKEGTVNGWDDADDGGQGRETESATDESNATGGRPDSLSSDPDGGAETGEVNGANSTDIPWVLRRNSITDGREQTVQLHLQEGTMNVQRTQKSIIESRLGESVRKADLREAALLVGLQRTDDIVAVLEEWGYALE